MTSRATTQAHGRVVHRGLRKFTSLPPFCLFIPHGSRPIASYERAQRLALDWKCAVTFDDSEVAGSHCSRYCVEEGIVLMSYWTPLIWRVTASRRQPGMPTLSGILIAAKGGKETPECT